MIKGLSFFIVLVFIIMKWFSVKIFNSSSVKRNVSIEHRCPSLQLKTQMPQSSANIKHKAMSLVAGTGFL
jgi:hypothetical protein